MSSLFGSTYWPVARGQQYSAMWTLFLITLFLSTTVIYQLGPALLAAPTWTLLPAAFIPFAVLFIFFRILDRWEPEPWLNIAVAVLWGGGVSVLVAGYLNTTAFKLLVFGHRMPEELASAYVAINVAPIVEESIKGLFVVWLFRKSRADMHSLMDGVFYTGIVASAFAFVENISYFLKPFGEYARYLSRTDQFELYGNLVFTRGVMSPFVHPMATTVLGLLVTYAYLYKSSMGVRAVLSFAGWVFAVLIHRAWNTAALTLTESQWYSFYLFVVVPAWIIWMLLLWRLSLRERRIIAQGLEPFLRTNMMSASEVAMVCDRTYRNEALNWAKSYGETASKSLKRMIHLMSQISMQTHLYHARGYDNKRAIDVHASLEEIAQLRASLQTMQQVQVDPLISAHSYHNQYQQQATGTTFTAPPTHSYDPSRYGGHGASPNM